MAVQVAIIGAHRSGTTALARVLSRLGIHMGVRRDRNHESVAHVRANNEILRMAGATWSTPSPLFQVRGAPRFEALVDSYLQRYWSALRPRAEYWGLAFWQPAHDASQGWKDPRGALTWPHWSRLAPDLSFIHVVRHGVDVAASLRTRADRALQRQRIRRAHPLAPPRTEWAGGAATLGLDSGMKLWADYVGSARAAKDSGRYLEVRYEELATGQDTCVEALASFLSTPAVAVHRATVDVLDERRVFAYRDHPGLRAIASRHEEMLEMLGYQA